MELSIVEMLNRPPLTPEQRLKLLEEYKFPQATIWMTEKDYQNLLKMSQND